MTGHEPGTPAPTSDSTPTSFEQLLARARTGCPEATQQLYKEYGDIVAKAVHRRLPPRLRSAYDTADFAQAAWASFLANPAEISKFRTPEDLLRYLCALAANKVGMAQRNRTSQKRDVDREEPLPKEDETPPDRRNPTPSQAAIASETWERLRADQAHTMRAVLDLLRAGFTHEEAAARLGIHPKTIQRFLKKIAQD
jgi:RNA polymerase sigma factor (sigma-70 family)